MWPKALAQLIELAPHITRLIPLADRFLTSRSAGDEATREQLAATVAQLNAQLNASLDATAAHIAQANAGIYRQLNEQGDRLAQLNAETQATRTELIAKIEALETKLQTNDRRATLQLVCMMVAAAASVAVLILVAVRVR
jgi:DNA anti-recombination protein RmuC